MITRFKLLLLLLVCMLIGLVSSTWMFFAILVGSPRAPLIASGFDNLANETFGDDTDRYLSSRFWRYRNEPRYAKLVKVVDWLADNPNHCQQSYEGEVASAKQYPNT